VTHTRIYTKNLRAAETAGGVGGNGGEGELTDGDGGAKIGGEAGGADPAAAGADRKEVEVVRASRLGAVL